MKHGAVWAFSQLEVSCIILDVLALGFGTSGLLQKWINIATFKAGSHYRHWLDKPFVLR
jgi:hypothetical protein